MSAGPARARATLLGFGAIALWSLLAVLTVAVGPVPPFQLAAMCFTLGGLVGLGWLFASGTGLSALAGLSPAVWALGIGGLFGYHAAYFAALRWAPPVPASLVNYLWPLLIVLFSGLLPGERLRPNHLVGAGLAFAGAWLVVAGPGMGFAPEHLPGLIAAGAAALIWSAYSVLSRRAGNAPTASVAVFCLAAAALSALCHLAFETTVWPQGFRAWAAAVALGVGPVGAAFYLWDVGCKRGDIQLLGVGAYAAPLVSTVMLILAGAGRASLGLGFAAALITLGALIAARSSPRRKAQV